MIRTTSSTPPTGAATSRTAARAAARARYRRAATAEPAGRRASAPRVSRSRWPTVRRCRGTEVGGDWYDAFWLARPRPSGSWWATSSAGDRRRRGDGPAPQRRPRVRLDRRGPGRGAQALDRIRRRISRRDGHRHLRGVRRLDRAAALRLRRPPAPDRSQSGTGSHVRLGRSVDANQCVSRPQPAPGVAPLAGARRDAFDVHGRIAGEPEPAQRRRGRTVGRRSATRLHEPVEDFCGVGCTGAARPSRSRRYLFAGDTLERPAVAERREAKPKARPHRRAVLRCGRRL